MMYIIDPDKCMVKMNSEVEFHILQAVECLNEAKLRGISNMYPVSTLLQDPSFSMKIVQQLVNSQLSENGKTRSEFLDILIDHGFSISSDNRDAFDVVGKSHDRDLFTTFVVRFGER